MFTPQSESSNQANLTERLEAFRSHTPVSVTPTNPLQGNLAFEEETEAVLEEALEEEQEAPLEEQEEETSETDETSPDFSAQFKQEFGIEPQEAKALVDELVNFRHELQVMRTWQVDPVEYDNRMSQVKEFYNSLPEEGREQFNSPEGAIAIWNHLSANAPKQSKKTRSTARSVRPQASSVPAYDFTRSQVNAMSYAELQKNWTAINQAYIKGRILEDVF